MNAQRKAYLLTRALGRPQLERPEKSELVFLCPNCRHRKPKLSVNTDTDEYNCWTCPDAHRTRGKTLTGLLAGRVSPAELAEYLASLDDPRERPRVQRVDDRRPVLPDTFAPLIHSPHMWAHWQYLRRRGVCDEDVLFHRLGACAAGDFTGRVIFPSFDSEGDLNFFTSRKISPRSPGPPYVTCDTSKDIIFNDCLIDWSLPVVLVEGPFDMLAVGRNAIPLQGKMLRPSSRLFQKLVRRAPRVYVCLDSDAQGDQMAVCHLLYRYCVDVRDVQLDGPKDPAEVGRAAVLAALGSARPYDMMSRVRRLCA